MNDQSVSLQDDDLCYCETCRQRRYLSLKSLDDAAPTQTSADAFARMLSLIAAGISGFCVGVLAAVMFGW
jgi:hypothetical protein